MSKFKLLDKCKKFCGSINLKDVKDTKDLHLKTIFLSNILESNPLIDTFYLVHHDETETNHIHYLIVYKTQIRGQTLLNYLADSLHIEGIAVNVDKVAYVGAHLRYMIHQDEESKKLNKKRYEVEDIISNDNREIIEGYLTSKSDDLTFEFLKKLVLAYSHEWQVMERLDLKLYHKYRFEIHFLYENRGTLMACNEELPF